MTKNSTFAACV